MNEKLNILEDIIKNRRTVKPEEFNGKEIEDAVVEKILESANWAPTHGMTEPWRFIVYAGNAAVRKFALMHAEIYKSETPAEHFLQKKYDAILQKPALTSHLIVMVMKRGDRDNIPEQEELAATACAAQNILLTASTSGLAVYWGTGGMTYHDAMKKQFELGERDKIIGLLYLGYSDKPHPEGSRNSTIEEKTRIIK